MALGNPTVHFFSLDIEGAEIPILRTIPFGKLDIKYKLTTSFWSWFDT